MYKDYSYASENPDHIAGYILKPILKIFSETTPSKILDFGCGNGWLVRDLMKHGYDAYGVDPSESGIAIARKGYPGRFHVLDPDTNKLPDELSEHSFQTIISTEVIEHLYSPDTFLQSVASILKESGGGQFILTTPYHGYLKNLLIAVMDKTDSHFSPLWEGGHIKFWSRKTLTTALNNHGFSVDTFKGCGRIPYLWKSMLLVAKI